MKHTLTSFISFCFLLSMFGVQAQEKPAIKPKTEGTKPEIQEIKKDSVIKTDRYGLRVGVDL